jgi:F420-non-reducing hydrogenase small subunit
MKPRISTEWLSGCSGCHVAMVDLHEKLLSLLDQAQFVRVPVLSDEKGYPQADIGIVEGAIRGEHDRDAVRKMRDSVSTLMAFGTCAVYGGPSGIGWLYDGASMAGELYGHGPTATPGEQPPQGAPKLERSVTPIDEVVKVDFYLPGCPPHPYWIALAAAWLLDPTNAKPLPQKTVCSRCDRRMTKETGVSLRKGSYTASDSTKCFLSQGVVCMGSVTMERCLSQCPNSGVACGGCCGPSADIVAEPQLDIRTLLARRINLLTGIGADEVRTYIEGDARTFYSYAMASPVIYKKPTVELREWARSASDAQPG